MAELTLNEKYQSLVGNNTDNINAMYDAQKASNLASLESAYNQNLSDATAQKQTIDNTYNSAANDLATQYERQRQNNNLVAAGNGLNTGTGSQVALAQSSQYQKNMGDIRSQQAQAQTEQDRAISNIKSAYQSQVAQAIAENDLARATALTNEANNQINQLTNAYQLQYNAEQDALDRQYQNNAFAYQQQQDALDRAYKEQQTAYQNQANAASLMASVGDYSGYANLFGLSTDQQGLLTSQWIANNPDSAYQSGMIDAEKYKAITGEYPVGYNTGYNYTPTPTNTTENVVLTNSQKAYATAQEQAIVDAALKNGLDSAYTQQKLLDLYNDNPSAYYRVIAKLKQG